MSYIPLPLNADQDAVITVARDYLIEVAKGNIPGHRIIHKFGAGSVGTTPIPITASGFWRTPTSPVSLEILSSSANDATGGTGATKVVIQGIDVNWNETLEEIDMNGATPVAIPTSLMRLHRWYVSESGAYANETTASYSGELKIRVAGGGADWDIIQGSDPYPGQSEIGVLTIPTGFTGYILSKSIFTDTSKTANIYFLHRPLADDVTTPYGGARRIIERDIGVSGGYSVQFKAPKGPYVGPCDIGFMAEVTVGTADVSVDFEMLLVQDGF